MKLSEICEINGVSGNETEVISYIKSKFGGRTDNLGTLISGSGNIAVAAIADEKGVFVSESGEKTRICPIGALKPAELINRRIAFSGGAQGFVCCDKDTDNVKSSDLYVISDFPPKIGETGCVEEKAIETDDYIITKAYARAASYAVALKLSETEKIKFMFTTMFFNGKKGLNAALFGERPDYTILIDTIGADGDKIKCGSGPVVKMMDGSYTADRKLRAFCDISECQRTVVKTPEIRSANSFSFGANTAVISVPVQYIGGYIGKILKSDIEKTAEFTKEFIKTIY